MTMPPEVALASKHFYEWLGELKERAFLQTHSQGYAMLRGVLHELRDHLTVAQTIAFADALPPLVRGIFYERWQPTDEPPPVRDSQEFLDAVIRRLAPHRIPPDSIVSDVFAVLAHRSEPYANRQMRSQLPDALAPLWPEQ